MTKNKTDIVNKARDMLIGYADRAPMTATEVMQRQREAEREAEWNYFRAHVYVETRRECNGDLTISCGDERFRIAAREFVRGGDRVNALLAADARERVMRRAFERQGGQSARARAFEYQRMHEQMIMYGMGAMLVGGGDAAKKPEKIAKLNTGTAPTEIISSDKKFTAAILDTNLKLFEESEAMRHCIYRSYTSRIADGEYIAYHVSAPHLGFKNGFTVGFRFNRHDIVEIAERREVKIRTVWKCEQIKGKANSHCNDRGLQEFADFIADTLTEKSIRYERHEKGIPFLV